MPNKIKRIVIAGGGTSGWLAAVALGKLMGKVFDVTLVESNEIGRIGVGEATIPPLRTFHKLVGIDERAFMSSTQSTFKLGIEFHNWKKKGDKYFHSFGVAGKDCWACDFTHFWIKGQQQKIASDFGAYCPEYVAAQHHKMGVAPDGSGLNVAYHLDAGLYAAFLREHATCSGVKRIEGMIDAVNMTPEGAIASLQMRNGQVIEGDLFLDCTGFSARLIEGALNVKFIEYGDMLPCDSAIAIQTERTGDPKPYTQAIAHDFGWQWRIPLQHRTGNGLVYSSRYVSEDEATHTLLSNLESKAITEPRGFTYRTGRRKTAWHKNCVAIGLASGFFEPVESTSIHLAMVGILKLLKALPNGVINASAINEFNRQTAEEMDRVRNFIILHYHATQREDSPFWRYCKNMPIPEDLRHRIELFRDTGAIPIIEKELFQVNSWTQVMMGQGIAPQSYHPIVDCMNDAELANFLKNIEKDIRGKVQALPSHQAFIDKYCKSKPLKTAEETAI